MIQPVSKSSTASDNDPALRLVPLIEKSSRLNKKLRYAFFGLLLSSVLMTAVIVFHEYFVLASLPVEAFHQLVHTGLLLVILLVLAAVWIIGVAYRNIGAYQRTLLDSYRSLDSIVAERTRALSDSQALLESLFDAFRERTLVVDRDTRIVHINKTAAGNVQGDLCGHLFQEVFPRCAEEYERRSELQLIRYTFAQGKPQRNRLIRGGADCDRIFSVDTYPVLNPARNTELVIEVVRDVTDSKCLEMKQQHYDKMATLGLLAAGIAHNLGNPLASLSSELQLLKGETDISRVQASLETLNRHVQRMTGSIHEILGFARHRGDTTRPVSLPDTVSDVLRLLRHDPRARDVRFETEFEESLPEVRFNEDDLMLILLNVVVNALDAMPAGGLIRFSGQRDAAGAVLLSVIDNGTGMDALTLGQATRPLFTTKATGAGTGLGLAVVDNVMQNANGSMSIESTPGKGTRIIFRLPVHNMQ